MERSRDVRLDRSAAIVGAGSKALRAVHGDEGVAAERSVKRFARTVRDKAGKVRRVPCTIGRALTET